MRLLIIRHAAAVPRGTPDMPDDERPLTKPGEKRFRVVASGLARIAKRPDVMLTSPLPRAQRTAQLAAKAWGKIAPAQVPALAGGTFEDVAAALGRYPEDATIVLVGHEPQLSELLARVIGTHQAERVSFRKGGAALVDLPGPLAEGGSLIWYISPRILRLLARVR